MCGIFGAVDGGGMDRGYCETVTRQSLAALRHRGPDGHGCLYYAADLRASRQEFVGNRLLLGHTRLAIIDLSDAGYQPMCSRDGRYALVFNGEIYNYIELRQELEAAGCRFDSETDSEVLLQAYAVWGERALSRFTGMFAFAIADRTRQVLFCARDCFGIKPFYYAAQGGAFRFSSELPALLAFPDVARDLAPQQVFDYLAYGSIEADGTTLFRAIRQLPPAHCMEVRLDTGQAAAPRPYWRIDLERRSPLSFADAAEALRSLFLDSVRLHLRSDAPLGVALSGGIDSSAVACCVRHLDPQRELHSFSYVAQDPRISEAAWIDIANAAAATVNHAAGASSAQMLADLPLLVRRLGEPFAGTSIYAQHCVFKLARQHGVVVVLEGQGADELLAGYDGFCMQRAVGLIRQGHFAKAALFLRRAAKWPNRSLRRLVLRCLRELRGGTAAPEAGWGLCDAGRLADLGVRAAPPSKGPYAHPDFVRATLANFISRENLPNLLRHGDRNAMTFSIENRVPFLTRELAEFLFSLPEDYLIDGNGRSKAVFREAMRGIVPDAILDRKDKIGFATPEQAWLGQIRQQVVARLREADLGMLRRDAALELARAEGPRADPQRLWRLVNYVFWLDAFGLRAC